MLNLPSNYLQFLLRPLPTHPTPRGVDVLSSTFLPHTLLWTLFFVSLFALVPRITQYLFPHWHAALPARKRREFPSYLVCLVHHIALVPLAWTHIYTDLYRTERDLHGIDYAVIESTVAPFCLAYLLGDTIGYAVPEWRETGKVEYLLHHAVTVWLIVASMFGEGHLLRFIPHLLVSDTTNLFFNSAWLLRLATQSHSAEKEQKDGQSESTENKAQPQQTQTTTQHTPSHALSTLITVLELCFALSFLLCRAVNLPLALFAAARSPSGRSLGAAVWSLLPIAGLQWYWFAKIVSGLRGRLGGGKKEKKNKKSE